MKAKVRVSEVSTSRFPRLMINDKHGFVLLVLKETCEIGNVSGLVVVSDGYWDVGHYSDIWAADELIDYNDAVELSND